MSDSTRRFLDSSRNIQIAAYSGLILRIFLLVLLNYHRKKDVNLHTYADLFNVYGGITICAIFVLLIGIYRRNHYFVIPYLAVIIIEIPITSIALIFDLVFLLHSSTYKMFLELLVGFAMIFWNFFTTWLLMNNYRQMELQHKLEKQLANLSESEIPNDFIRV